MPELPEVETIKKQLEKSIKGRKIKAVSVFTDKMVQVGEAKISNIKKGSKFQTKEFILRLIGRKVLSLERRAKYLIIRLSGEVIIMIHLRMSGQLLFLKKSDLKKPLRLSMAKKALEQTLPTKHTHVSFLFTDDSTLFYNDTRQFGHLRVVTKDQYEKVLENSKIGPEPLTLSLKDFDNLVKMYPTKRIKDFLLDQTIIAGIGNIYADEALFLAKIRPDRKMQTLLKPEIKRLRVSIIRVLKDAIKAGGSSLEYFLMTNGDSGKFVSSHQVYGRSKEPCIECGEILETKKIASRTTVYCKICQS
jgi:formamidopyrimidine-DNA glycosylase